MTSPTSFTARHNLFTAQQHEAAEQNRSMIEQLDLEVVRLAWPDQHGLIRGKTMTREGYLSALKNGVEITMAPFFFDTANAIVFNPFSPGGGFDIPELSGSPNVTMVPDPVTFRVLPWAPQTGWVLCDLYLRDGSPFPFAPRTILRNTLHRVHEAGYRFIAGIEIEWYLTRVLDTMLETGSLGAPGIPGDPPKVAPVARGYSYLLESHLDEIDEVLRPIRKALVGLGLPLRSVDDEWAPSQVEVTFDVMEGMAAADAVLLMRSAIKQIARRRGHLASFMCCPAIPGFYASGWHLHSSLVDAVTGENLMVPDDGAALSELGRHYVGGSLAHGVAASAFTTQSINGYRRRRPYSLAPDRLTWGFDNRAAMMRVISAPNDPASHVENRIGEPSANPYLYIAAQAAAGLDGVLNKIDPGPLSDDPYAADATQLPTSLADALTALDGDEFFRRKFGAQFVDYLIRMKCSEVDRYRAHLAEQPDPEQYAAQTTEWEHREYFELY
ncbi:glutamine synthetase family protein [Pseudonocardia asaccharolytica]|uniref:Glutamine synthetase n=1 Tax=Pseudonocardia asaccharolytica DSM 44247 = NBRC 16224 TaxID=1123024 RepID=A0A511D201_9PSEU|nr:glutamine synthetase family protein [Pseudonocardia asaccharolytica]GEL18717.1 glutamine synthetase [Pseudonocardia asaccharolytica DSM 44247 = NBRC 16224]